MADNEEEFVEEENESRDLEEDTIYEEKFREEMVEDDEISSAEEGFMQGYKNADKEVKELRKKKYE